MDFNKRIEESLGSALSQISEVKNLLKSRSHGNSKWTSKDTQNTNELLDKIVESVNALAVIATKSGLENMGKLASSIIEKPGQVRPTYAKAAYDAINTKPIHRAAREKTIIINKSNYCPVDELFQNVNSNIREMRSNGNKTKISRVIKSKTSVIVMLLMTEDLDQLINDFKKSDQIKNNAKIYPARMLNPVIVFKGIQSCLKSDEIVSSVWTFPLLEK